MANIQKLEELLGADPGDAFLMHALALENIKVGNDDQAQRLLTEILTNNPAYVGSYYHLGRSLERTGQPAIAATWYEKGMLIASQQGDRHAYNELQAAFDDITDP